LHWGRRQVAATERHGTPGKGVKPIAVGRQPPELTAHRLIRTVDPADRVGGTEAAARHPLTERRIPQTEPPILN
jgi:hypothetical protein